ncbi:MAG: ferritin [Candidatus Limnocylindria bacterium]
MISDRLREFLVDQIGHELTAHQDYLGIAVYFQQRSLLRWARYFRDQAIEEAQHATRIMDFLVDNEVEFDLPPLSGATSQFESAMAAAQAALESERSVSARFREASQLALAEGDHTTHQFLQWFVAEQVEEEAKILNVIDLIASGINLFQAEQLLDALDSDG